MTGKIYCYFMTIWLCAAIATPQCMAENRALLIGVSRYAFTYARLPGIDKDIINMKQVVRSIGFKRHQVKFLNDSQATLDNIISSIEKWLINGTSKKDRVLFYFSGHGSYIKDRKGDEVDGYDEVLLTHDTKIKDKTLLNTLVDDRFAKLLERIPAKEVFVFIDACHSGTATKDINVSDSQRSKFFYYPGISSSKNIARGYYTDKGGSNKNYVALSACQDDERAVATEQGSLFTSGILNAVNEALAKGTRLTMHELKEKTALYISRNADPDKVHRPNLLGNQMLMQKDIFIEGVKDPDQPFQLWSKLKYLVEKSQYNVDLSVNKKKYRIGDRLVVFCQVNRTGYLNILEASYGDETATVLFPNKYHPENYVLANTKIQIPSKKDLFKIPAGKRGRSTLVAIHTSENINAFKDSDDSNGLLFKVMSRLTLKKAHEVADGGIFGGKSITVYVE